MEDIGMASKLEGSLIRKCPEMTLWTDQAIKLMRISDSLCRTIPIDGLSRSNFLMGLQ
jgi:hypothetical protein